MNNIPFGPTYEEMLHPKKIDKDIRKKALKALKENELDPVNLFNINWKDENNEVHKIVLPKELTGEMEATAKASQYLREAVRALRDFLPIEKKRA